MNCPLCSSSETREFFRKKDKTHGEVFYLKCSRCLLIFISERFLPSSDLEKRIYDQHQNTPENSGYVQFLKRLADPLCKKLQPSSVGLDFGSGPGPTLSLILEKQGYHVKNFDPIYAPDSKLLKHQFDFITSTEVVEHLHTPRKTFDVLESLLKPKSFLGIMTQFVERENDFKGWWYHRDPTHVCFFRRETFEWISDWKKWGLEFPSNNVVIFST